MKENQDFLYMTPLEEVIALLERIKRLKKHGIDVERLFDNAIKKQNRGGY